MQTLFSTAGTHPRNNFRRWSEVIFDRIVPVEQKCLGDRPFEGKLETADVGSLLITRVSQSALRTVATPDTIRRHGKHGTLSVALKLTGVSTSTQDDRESVQRPGDIVVLDRRPTVLTSSFGSQSLFMEVPRERLERMLGSARIYSALTVGADQASASLVLTYFKELVRVHDRLDADTAARMSSIGLDLLVASIAERLAREVPRPLHGTVVVQRAKAYVEANLGDPTLDPSKVAAAVGVSLRRLQELFQERGRHLSDWIWQRRLEVAAKRLIDPGYRHLPIGTLAHGCGFSSQPHFSRRFKDRFEMTPSEYRSDPGQDPLAAAGSKQR